MELRLDRRHRIPVLGCRAKLCEVITASAFYKLRQHLFWLKSAVDVASGHHKTAITDVSSWLKIGLKTGQAPTNDRLIRIN